MASIITKILLNNKDFDNNMRKSRQQVQDFEKGFDKAKSSIATAFKGIAGAVGVGLGAMEAFNRTMNASQTTGDAMASAIEQAKASVDTFFYTLSTGDMTPFLMGLEEVRRQAAEVYEALDQLGNVDISFGYLGGKEDVEIAKYRTIALDQEASKEEREEALVKWREHLDAKHEMAVNTGEAARDALYKMVAEGTMLYSTDIDQSDYDRILQLDLKNAKFREEEKTKLANEYEKYRLANEELALQKGGTEVDSQGRIVSSWKATDDVIEKVSKKQRALSLQYKEAILYQKILVRWKDEELRATVEIASKSDRIAQSMYQQEMQYNRATTRTKNQTREPVEKEEPLEGSIAYYDKLISELNAKLKNEVDASAASAIKSEIKAIQEERYQVTFVINRKYIEDNFAAPAEISGSSMKMPSMINLPDKIEPIEVFKPDSVDNVNEMTEAMQGFGAIMNSVNSITAEGTAGWISYGANLLNTIAMAIPQVIALTSAKEAEAQASAKGAIAEAGRSAAMTPFVGGIMAVAAIASVIAALTNIPKFASGGIVGGGSHVGDKVLIAANSGEVILNRSQQANLVNQLDGGSNINIGVDRIRGSDLFLSLNNYMKSSGKKL